MSNLNKFTVEELQAEIDSRVKIHRFEFQGETFEATMDEIKTLQAALNKLNPPINPLDEYLKAVEKNRARRTDIDPPWTFPVYPGSPVPKNPWKTEPYTDPPIWCKQHPDSFEVWTTSSKLVGPFRISLDNPQDH